MPTRVVIAGYRVTSADATLSPDDEVVNSRTGEKRALKDVYNYLTEVDSKLARDWQEAVQGRLKLSLRPFEKKYVQKLFQTSGTFSCEGSEELRCPKGGPPLRMETCFYEAHGFRIIARRAPGIVCAGPTSSTAKSLLKKYEGKILRTGWGGHASNCFTYATRSVTGWGSEMSLDDVFSQRKGQKLQAAFPLEVLLEHFFRPVAVIGSMDISLRQVVEQANDHLNILLQEGKLDESKALQGDYLMIFSVRVRALHEGQPLGVILHSPHAGLLHYDPKLKRWSLEGKLGTGGEVVQTDVGAQIFFYQMGLAERGSSAPLFFRIYETGLAESQDLLRLKEALKKEPIVDESEILVQ